MTTPVLVTEQLGAGLNLASAMNDRTRRAMLNRVVADYKLGDQTIMAAVDKLDKDLRVEIKKALDAAGTLDSGIQKAQLEAIIDRLMSQPAFVAGMGSKTAMVGGQLTTLASIFDAQFFRQPRPAREEFTFASDDDAIPAGSVVTMADGAVSVFTTSVADSDTDGDGKNDLRVIKFSSTSYGGLAAEWELGLHMIPDLFLGQASVTFREKYSTRIVFDLSQFFVAGSDIPVTSIDVDGNGTTNGTVAPTGSQAVVGGLQAALDNAVIAEASANADASAAAVAVGQAQAAVDAAPAGTDVTTLVAALTAAQAAYDAAAAAAATKSADVVAARNALNAYKAANGIV